MKCALKKIAKQRNAATLELQLQIKHQLQVVSTAIYNGKCIQQSCVILSSVKTVTIIMEINKDHHSLGMYSDFV